MAGPLDGVNPILIQRFLALQAAAAAAGHTIGVGSALRDAQRQAQLRIDNGCPDVHTSPASSCRVPTARPGTSNHEFGLAIDITGNAGAKGWVGQNAANFGLHLPVNGEDWHLEMIEDNQSRGFTQAAQQQGGIGFDMQWADQAQDPEAAMDARIQALMGAITGAQRDALADTPMDPMLETPGTGMLDAPMDVAVATPAPEMGLEQPTMAEPVPMDTTTLQPPAGGAPGGQFEGDIPPVGYVPPGEGVDRWRDVALAALRYTGQPEHWVDLLLQRMNQESGGNPTVVNDWDSNAQRGDPSIGLMQNIGSAFPERAQELTSRGIRDGFANIVASIRYTLGRYGTLNAWAKPGGY